jgi:hypothetical protein
MTDNNWKLLIWDTTEMEKTCEVNLKKHQGHFEHLNLAFYSGISGDPALSMELMDKKAKLMRGRSFTPVHMRKKMHGFHF